MLRKIVLSVFSMAALFCVQAAAQTAAPAKTEGGPTVDELIAKHAQARGGLEKLKAVKSMKLTGKVIVQGGAIEIPMIMQVKRPNAFRMESTFQGKTMIQAFDGATGWGIVPFTGQVDPEKMSEEDAKEAKEQGDNFFEGELIDYKAKGSTVELLGKEDVEGTDTYKLKVTNKNGDVDLVYLDAKNYLEIKSTSKRKRQGAEIEVEAFPGDYKEEKGIMMPHAIENKPKNGPPGAGSQIVIEKVEFDVPMDDAIFKMPAKAPAKAPEKK